MLVMGACGMCRMELPQTGTDLMETSEIFVREEVQTRSRSGQQSIWVVNRSSLCSSSANILHGVKVESLQYQVQFHVAGSQEPTTEGSYLEHNAFAD